jgi:hypothetical protein
MMGGGGGGYDYSARDAEDIQRALRERLSDEASESEINKLLTERLTEVNQRDTEEISTRLDAIKEALADEARIDKLLYGGSVAKHTYVDGLSDVDSLVVLDREDLAGRGPESLREGFAQLLREKLPASQVDDVSVGKMAVTVHYRDGIEIQLLPAATKDGQLSISSQTGTRWKAIEPEKFAQRLTEVNQAQGGRVVPVIKLAKAVIAGLPERARLSGYHVEALAVGAFSDYRGGSSLKDMVTHLFDSAASNILKSVPDITGQSRHVDERWGKAGSAERRAAAVELRRVAEQMKSDSSAQTWTGLLEGS